MMLPPNVVRQNNLHVGKFLSLMVRNITVHEQLESQNPCPYFQIMHDEILTAINKT
jgi:hypothetical protein